MSDRPELSDDDLHDLLARRAARARADNLLASVRAAAAVTPQRRRIGRLGLGLRMPGPLAAGVTGVAGLALLAGVVLLATGGRGPEVGFVPGSASPGASIGPSASVEPPATPIAPGSVQPVLPLSVAQLNVLMGADPRQLSGRELVIDGSISGCAQLGGSCPDVVLQGSNPQLGVEPAAGQGGRPWSSRTDPLTGPFAARLVDDHTLEYQGPVTLTGNGSAFLPSELTAAESADPGAGLRLVEGWITGRTDPLPCPYPGDLVSPEPQYGCGETAILSDTNIQPETSDSFTIPPTSVQVQNGAYLEFAPDPSTGIDPVSSPAHLSEPEVATFLVEVGPPVPCPSGTFCALDLPGRHWQIIDRVDPWPDLGGIPTPAPTVVPSPSAPVAAAPVLPLTVDQLNAYMQMNSQSPDGRQLVITGTIVPNEMAMLCTGSCTGWLLEGSNPSLFVKPVGVWPGPWNQAGQPLTGTFAATMAKPYQLEYQGPVSMAPDGVPWLPSQLPSPVTSDAQSGFWLVHAWLAPVETSRTGCPYLPIRSPQYGCGNNAVLSDTPTWTGAPNTMPTDGFQVQNGAYADFSPPAADGSPQSATFLLRTVQVCMPGPRCSPSTENEHWEIVARVGPWPVAALP